MIPLASASEMLGSYIYTTMPVSEEPLLYDGCSGWMNSSALAQGYEASAQMGE